MIWNKMDIALRYSHVWTEYEKKKRLLDLVRRYSIFLDFLQILSPNPVKHDYEKIHKFINYLLKVA